MNPPFALLSPHAGRRQRHVHQNHACIDPHHWRASGALATAKHQSTAATPPSHDVYDARGVYVGSDPDQNIRFDLQRDGGVRGSN